MKIIDVDGTSYERGLQQGEKLKEEFNKMIDEVLSSELWKENKPNFIPNSIVKLIFGILGSFNIKGYIKKYLPYQFKKIEGLNKGLGINGNFIWGIQFLEIIFCAAGKTLKAPENMGCTQVHAQPDATKDGHPLLGRNYDFPNILQPYQIVRREIPSEKRRYATMTVTQIPFAGTHQGINEHGLIVAANNARLWKGKDFKMKGVPYMIIMQEILETCRFAGEASNYLVNFPFRTNTGFFGIMDASGDDCVVEFTASRAMIRKPSASGVMAQTNHFHVMKDANLPKGTYWTVKGMEGLEYAKSTEARFAIANRLIHEYAGKIDVEIIKSILRNHDANNGTGNDLTICCHGISGGTLSSIIFDATERRLHIADGNPCEKEYEVIDFRQIRN